MTKGPKSAQATKSAAITPEGSIDLAQSLVQVGIANICYHRDVLPLDNFETVKIQGLEKVDTKMLVNGDDVSPETKVINNWLNHSVSEALKTGFATKLFFGLAGDPECRNIFEEYVFVFEHDEDGNISLANLEDGKGRARPTASSKYSKPTIFSAKKQVSSLLRNIVYVTSTLAAIPEERYVFMKFEFSADCPEDYQPSGFCDAGDNAVGFFSTKPFSMRLGVLNTPYHNVLLGVRSVLEDMDSEPNKGPTADDISRWETTMVSGDDGGKEGNNSAELDHHMNTVPYGQTNDDLADLFETEPQSFPQGEDVSHRLQRLNVGACAPSQGGGGAGKSCAGGIYSVPGSVRTESRAYNAVSNARYNNHAMDDEDLSDAEDEVQGRGGSKDDNKVYAETQIKAHRRKVFCLSWNCDGTRLATGSQDQTIKLWKTDDQNISSKSEAELRGHTDAVMYLRWHPSNPDRLASTSSQEKCIRFWDARTSKNTATLTTPGHNLYLAWTHDGNEMAVGSKEDVVCIIDVRKMKVIQKHSYRYQVNELAFLSTSRLFLQATGNGGEVEVQQYPDMKRVGGLKGHTAAVLSLAVDPAEKYIATGGADAVACLWDAKDFICLRSYYAMDFPPRALAFSYDSKYLAMAGEDPCLFVEDIESGKSMGIVPVKSSPEDCAWHPKRHVLAYPVEVVQGESSIEFRTKS
ncbi:hypothetical protein Ndes2437B_g05833 [Nannochloris sp. 'desiccata']